MLRRTSWIIVSVLIALAAVAAITAVGASPPNLAKTIEAQRRLTFERPDDAAVFNDLGNLLLLVPQPAEAETAYRRALELDPGRVSALFNLALLLQQRGELREAAQLYQRVLRAEPRHAWAWYQTGAIHEVWKQRTRAVEAYAQAFALDPQLAFPEVNAHIVDNKLVTEAMLRAYRNDYARPQAPAIYDDPSRIASLLVPAPTPAQGDAAGQVPQELQAGQPAPGASRPPAVAAPQGQQGQGATVLRERDLDRDNAVGQAQPQGGARPSVGGVRQPASRGLREWTRPEPTIQEIPSDEMVDEGLDQPAPVITPPPGGVYYRPGIQSTGRLNLRVVPERVARVGRRG